MMRSLFSGVAGLRTHQTKMDVIGNNIANVNTIGFKSSAVTFQDIMYQTTSGAAGATETLGGRNANQTGLGVQTGATKISIESGGAAQSTGEAFDLRFTDQSSTNFFVVSNGSQQLFTRAGSFYIDGAGNLAMSTTGYIVQGWQYNEDEGFIQRDLVSPLRIMSPENRTSTPEWTTDAYVSGVLDKNDPMVVAETGYINTVTVYDNLGYEYNCKFSTKLLDADSQQYTMTLESITNSQGQDILAGALGTTLPDGSTLTIDRIFGKADSPESVQYQLMNPKQYPVQAGQISYTRSDKKTFYLDNTLTPGVNLIKEQNPLYPDDPTKFDYYLVMTEKGANPSDERVKASNVFGMSSAKLDEYVNMTPPAKFTVDSAGSLKVEYTATNEQISYNTQSGLFESVASTGDKTVGLNLSFLGDAFTDITLDFSTSLAYDNGGSSTLGMDRGQLDNLSMGAGRKLGTLTGLSVSQDGSIFGSYDNGTRRCLGQIAVAQFANASGLESLGNNCYATTLNSGDFDGIGKDVTADGGQINSGQLEMSNVDLSQEFTEMITTQRGFQANSRIITVSDTMLEELTNLKR